MNASTPAGSQHHDTGQMVVPPRPSPPATEAEIQKLKWKLASLLSKGLKQAGFKLRGRPYIWRIEQGHPLSIWMTTYDLDPRWWRITVAYDFPGVFDTPAQYCEFTMHRDEFTEETIADLARFLREPTSWRWPRFAHWNSYPTYAWSHMGWETYRTNRLEHEAWENWKKGKASR